MDTIRAKEELARFLASQSAPMLAQALLELAEDYEPVRQRLERMRLHGDPAALKAEFTERLQRWEADHRYVRHEDAADFGHELDVWVNQVQREVLPHFPAEAMTLFAAFLDLDRVIFERVDDDGCYIGGSFELASQLWMTAAQSAGLSVKEISARASELLAKDDYGARSPLAAVLHPR